MSDNNELYEPDLISVTDDDGNEIVFELLERYETDDDVYVAITEYHDEAEEIVEADNEVIILKVLEENGRGISGRDRGRNGIRAGLRYSDGYGRKEI